MIAEIFLAVLPSFISTVTEHFRDGRRDTVTVADLQDQVVRLLASHRQLEIEVAQAQRAVVTLTRYLALTHGEAFALQGGRLELAVRPPAERRVIIGHAMEDFNSSVVARVQRQRNRPPTSPKDSSEALDRFFEGFEEEVMRARLGREE